MNEQIVDLMRQIAVEAMATGKDISLEQKEYFHDAKGIGGLCGGHTEDTGVILRAWQPERKQEEDPEEEEA